MKIKIEKPLIPILFLDTFFFIDLINNRHSTAEETYFAEQLELIDLIHKLTKQKKLLCPKGDQEEEYELGKFEDEIREEQVKLSYGISVMHYGEVQQRQEQVAIKAYIKQQSELTFDYKCLFQRDPVKELQEALSHPYIIDVHIPTPIEWIDKQKQTKQELADAFEILRKEKIKQEIKFSDWLKHEKLGTHNAILNTIKTAIPKIAKQKALTQEEGEGLRLMSNYLIHYSHYAKRNATPKDVIDFLKSEYYECIPYIDIQSGLYASLLTQSGVVKDTDNFDFHQTEQMLPFSSFFLTDRSLKHRLESNPLAYDKKYDVRIYSKREMRKLISQLSKL